MEQNREMKFKKYPYGMVMMNVGIVVFGVITMLLVLGAIFIPNGRTELLIMSGVGCMGIGAILIGTRGTHGWVNIDSIGIRQKGTFGYVNLISWEECVDVGIARGDRGTGGVHIWVPWLYFSKVKLSQEQVFNTRKVRLKNNNIIMIRCREEVLDEVLKYIDKERIRNLYLFQA